MITREAVDLTLVIEDAVVKAQQALGLLPHLKDLEGDMAYDFTTARAGDLLNVASEINRLIVAQDLAG